jgi:hypothetical protein
MKIVTIGSIKNSLIILLLLSAPALSLAAVRIELEVVETTTPAELAIVENNAKCSLSEPDCIEVSRGSSPNMFFDLDTACESPGAKYKLTEIRIAMEDKGWPTPSNPLPADVAEDYLADPETGIIDLSGNHGRRNKLDDYRIKLKNMNNNPSTVYYEITAEHCTDSSKPAIKLDPRIRNLGK